MNAFGRLFLLFVVVGCTQPAKYKLQFPAEVKPFEIPADNLLTEERIELGRRLFYEKGLSLDSSVSCASCHIQQFAFADTARVSVGFHGDTGFRNASSLTNIAFQTAFFRDGGVFTLERAVHPPVLGEFEMNLNLTEMLARLNNNQSYTAQFQEAFGGPISHKTIVDALASFQRTLNSFNTPFDAFVGGDENTMSESQKRGFELFKSDRLNCAACHPAPLFMDNKMHNVGLYEVYHEYGRGRVTLKKEDFGKFRTPTLRNIAVTFPYMHDGSLKTLEAVIDFYASGGKNHPNKSDKLKSFTLTAAEKTDLLAFLLALTDSTFLVNPAFSAPN